MPKVALDSASRHATQMADPLVRSAVVGAVSKPVAEPAALAHQPACIRLGIKAVGRRGDVEPEAPLKRLPHLELVGLQMQRRGQHVEPGAAVVAARRDETAALAVDDMMKVYTCTCPEGGVRLTGWVT